MALVGETAEWLAGGWRHDRSRAGARRSIVDVDLQPRVIEIVVGWLGRVSGRVHRLTRRARARGPWTSR